MAVIHIMKRHIISVLLFTSLFTSLNLFGITKDESDFFEKKIRPVLSQNCYKCHSANSTKVKGKLLLDTKAGSLKGGESGAAVIPGNIEQSLLLKSIRYTEKELQMPPDGKLSDSIIKDFETWVKMGAPDPRVSGTKVVDLNKAVNEHWAYQPIKKPTVPDIKAGWISNPVDNFIYAKLKENNLMPSLLADNKILIRRIYFDLIGLPPTEQETENFVNDKSPDAYEKLIDALLKSPRYGERWGRHWLDTARYSDTTGSVNANQEPRYTYSYTYRDYVIRSFNEDKPFNQFIMEQIAADKLTDVKKEDLAALGFLTLGKSSGNANDVIDDRIDAVFKGFMATTLVCSRCHDHKFDPFTTQDYYAMHGVFNSSYVPVDDAKPILHPIKDTPEYRDYLAKKQQIEVDVETFIDSRHATALVEFRTNTFKNIFGGYILNNVAESNRTDYVRDNALNTRMIQKWSAALNVKINVSNRQNLKGVGKAKESNINHPSFLPLAKMFKVADKDFKVEFSKVLTEHADDINPYLLHQIRRSSITTMKDLATAYHNAVMESHTASTNIAGVVAFRESIYKNNGPLDISRDSFQRFYSDNGKTMRYDNELRLQRGKLITHELTHVATPARAMAFVDKDRATDSPVLIKGDPGTRGPIVPRRWMETFSYLNPNQFTNGSGRLELAKIISDKQNPLTARVIVNRVWQFHFGEGLVRTPDDFGIQTEKPTHNELLNYLSARFMEDGWSVNKLHKLLLMSSTYKQTVNSNAKKGMVDPYNKFYWRMNLSRLDFETLRDTILYMGGKLNLSMGGQSVNLVTLNNDTYSTRRTVYGLVDRGRLPEVFTTFDFATPEMTTGKRFQTTVPKQALFLMNNSMVVEQVRNMVTRSEFTRIVSEEEKVKSLYRICFQRDPSPLEIKVALAYMVDAMKEDMSDVKKEYNWKYGYRVIDQKTKSLSKFFELPTFEKETYKSTNAFFVNLTINKTGGELMNNPNIYSIRQWVSPREGLFQANGTFKLKPSKDVVPNVNLFIYKNDRAIKTVNINSYAESPFQIDLNKISVNDKIEFVLVNSSKLEKDYTVLIKIDELKDENSFTPVNWNSQSDFRAPIKKIDRELNGWERYAHILLMSNEMIFIN